MSQLGDFWCTSCKWTKINMWKLSSGSWWKCPENWWRLLKHFNEKRVKNTVEKRVSRAKLHAWKKIIVLSRFDCNFTFSLNCKVEGFSDFHCRTSLTSSHEALYMKFMRNFPPLCEKLSPSKWERWRKFHFTKAEKRN